MYEILIRNGDESEKLHEMDENSLRRVSACQFVRGVNLVQSAEGCVFKQNPAYDKLTERITKVRIVNTRTGKSAFSGRLLRLYDDGMDSSGVVSKKFICEGYMAYLCDSIQLYRRYVNMRPGEVLGAMLDVHNAQVEEDKRIFLGATISGEIKPIETNYRNTLEEIKSVLIEEFGGEISIREGDDGKLYLDWTEPDVESIVNDTPIELANNMISLKKESDSTHIITRLIPLGAMLKNENGDTTGERLTIAGVNPNGKVYIDDEEAMEKYGVVVGTAIFDECEAGTDNGESRLLSMGNAYLKNNNRIRRSFRAQALDLSTIGISADALEEGNIHRFANRLIPINEPLRIQKITTDIFSPYKPVLEIGDKAEKITSIAARQAQLIEYEMPKQKVDILASAKATASELVKAGFEGYVSVNPNEILIMNHPDKEIATKIWRFNVNGIGYSSTGYHGEYGLAMTMDGAIVADFITAGVLRGLEILNGNGKFHVHEDGTVEAGAINITGGSVNMETTSETNDMIELACGNVKTRLSPIALDLRNEKENRNTFLQNGGIWFYKNGEIKANISAEAGTITCYGINVHDGHVLCGSVSSSGAVSCGSISSNGAVSCSDVNFGTQNGGRALLSILEARVAALEAGG